MPCAAATLDAAPADPKASALSGRPVLVTGASGFLGRHLCHRLAQLGAQVHAITRPDRRSHPSLPGVAVALAAA